MPLEAGPTSYADRSTAQLAAARFLAKFHSIALEYPKHSPRLGVPAWREWDWGEQEWSSVEVLLSSQPDTATGVAQRFWREGGKWGEARRKLRKRFSVLSLTLTQNKQ